MRANNGVVAFSMPARELLTRVCANENKNAGIKFPINATIINGTMLLRFILFSNRSPNGSVINEANDILMAATCTGVNTISPFFMRMKEAPQINPSRINIIQW